MTKKELKEFLDQKSLQYEHPQFIETDPIQIPHLYTVKQDIEIAGFLTATISWGNRKSILTNAHKLMNIMGNSPHDFVLSHTTTDLEQLEGFVHRTFNSIDITYFMRALKYLYTQHEDMESLFIPYAKDRSLQNALHEFRSFFFSIPHPERTTKHVSDPKRNSAAKRLHMFLRWMVRPNTAGVDLGIWKNLSTSQLSCPLDVHSGNVARKLKLLKRKQNDGKAVLELDTALRKLDSNDPVKYDYALFGLGVFENF